MESNFSESLIDSSNSENSSDSIANVQTDASNTEINENTDNVSTWNYSDGISGEGDKPDWFDNGKYKTISEQAKAHSELQKKFGGFSGAPEKYELSIEEGVSSQIDHESEEFKEFEQFARESNMNNETFNNIINKYVKNIDSFNNIEISKESIEERRNEEINKLGPESTSIINEVSSWGKNNLSDDEFGAFKNLANSADNIKLMQTMIGKISKTKINSSDSNKQKYTKDELSGMINDEYYSNFDVRKKVDGLWADFLKNT